MITSPKCSYIIITQATPITEVSSGFHYGVNLNELSWHYTVCWEEWHSLARTVTCYIKLSEGKNISVCYEWDVTSRRVAQFYMTAMCYIKLGNIWYEEQHLHINMTEGKHNEWHVTTCTVTPDRIISVTGISSLFVLQIFSKYMPHKSQPKMN